MKNYILLLGLWITIPLSAAIVEIKTEDEFSQNLEKEMPKFIDFYAPWCGPCKVLKPIIEKLSEEYPSILFMSVDGDTLRKAAKIYSVKAYPTLIYLDKYNGESKRTDGFGNSKYELDEIKSNLRKISSNVSSPLPKSSASKTKEPLKKSAVMLDEEIMPIKKPTKKLISKENIKTLTTAQDFMDVVKSKKPVFIHFYIAACRTCLDVEDEFIAMQKQYGNKALFVRINAENDSMPGVTGKPGIIALPSYSWLFVEKDMNKPFTKKERSKLNRTVKNIITEFHKKDLE